MNGQVEDWTYLDTGEIFVTATLDSDMPAVVANLAGDVDEADGEKMAAARELCDALQGLLSAVEADKVLGLGQWTDAAHAALAKAGVRLS